MPLYYLRRKTGSELLFGRQGPAWWPFEQMATQRKREMGDASAHANRRLVAKTTELGFGGVSVSRRGHAASRCASARLVTFTREGAQAHPPRTSYVGVVVSSDW